jgi:hypothetical protein
VVVDFCPWGRGTVRAESRMTGVRLNVTGVSETPSADVEGICVFADEIFGVNRLVPRLKAQIAEDDVLDVAGQGLRLRIFGRHGHKEIYHELR